MIIACNEKNVPKDFGGWAVIKKLGDRDYCPGIWKRKAPDGKGWQICVDTEEFYKGHEEVRKVLSEVLYVDDFRRIYRERVELFDLLDQIDKILLPAIKDLPSYSLDCDVYSIRRVDHGAYVSLTDDEYGSVCLEAFIYNEIKGTPKDVKVNQRIRVCGFLTDHPGHGSLRLMPYSVVILDQPTKADEQRKEWRERLAETPPVMGRTLVKDCSFAKIGVIAPGAASVSYSDFLAVLTKNAAGIEVVPRFGRMDAFSISERLEYFAKMDDVEAVCIIRGGAVNPHFEFVTLDSPTLCRAIAGYKKPVLTGIGHAEDNPFCTRYVDYNAKTATDLAYRLSRMYSLPEAKERFKEEIKGRTKGSIFSSLVEKLFRFLGWK